jgi:hypothetical protein
MASMDGRARIGGVHDLAPNSLAIHADAKDTGTGSVSDSGDSRRVVQRVGLSDDPNARR